MKKGLKINTKRDIAKSLKFWAKFNPEFAQKPMKEKFNQKVP